MAEYLDGTLETTRRAAVEDHVSRCEDCYFVVTETSLMSAQRDAEALGRPRSWLSATYLLPIAATLTLVSGSIALWRLAQPAEAYAVAVQPLVEAVGDRRFFEPRLAGGFRYGPRVEVRRAAQAAPASGTWAVLSVAKKMRSGASPPSEGARAARAAAAIFLGEVDEAVAEYANLVRSEPEKAEWACNLSAALLVRAAAVPERAETDLKEALRFADQAVLLNAGLIEARFNRGLALRALGRAKEAEQVFAGLAAKADAWGGAAREQLETLAGPSRN